jgi:hypothetical protein
MTVIAQMGSSPTIERTMVRAHARASVLSVTQHMLVQVH